MHNRDDKLFNPVEILATFVGIIIIAISIPISQQQGFLSLIGNSLAVVGALLSSAVGAWVISRKQSTTDLRVHLTSVQRHLHTSLSKLQTAVSEGLNAEEGDERVALIKIQEVTDSLSVVLADISSLSGTVNDQETLNMSKIIGEIRGLQSVFDHVGEIEEDSAGKISSTEAVLEELQQKVGKLNSEISKIPGQVIHEAAPRTRFNRVQRWMTLVRRNKMNFLGVGDQQRVLELIYDTLIADKTPRLLSEISAAILNNLRQDDSLENFTKTKISAVFRILIFTGVVKSTNARREDGVSVAHYFINDDFSSYQSIVEAHNYCLIAFADHCKVSDSEISAELSGESKMNLNRASSEYKNIRQKVEDHLLRLEMDALAKSKAGT